jgi:retinol dehydrogenase 12
LRAIAVITGTTHGIGRVTSRELARAGRTVVMLCRDLAAARTVRDEIIAQVPCAQVDAIHCDLALLASVRACFETLRGRYPRIDLLVNNAGIASVRHRMSADGFELTFATNHLGPFLLTALLLEHLSDEARVVNVASHVHFRGRIDLASVSDPLARYSSMRAYAQSKLANVLHTFALARRVAGSGICVNCLHPGVVATNLLPRWVQIIKPLISPVVFDAERGARTTLHLALAESVAGMTGLYFDEHQLPQPAAEAAQDEQLQEALWEASARWVGLLQ